MSRFFERRAYPRIEVGFPVTLSGSQGNAAAQALDVSIGGLRLDLQSVVPPPDASAFGRVLYDNALVSVEFSTHDDTQVQAFARVRWSKDGSTAFGVEFLDLSPTTRAAVNRFIEALREYA